MARTTFAVLLVQLLLIFIELPVLRSAATKRSTYSSGAAEVSHANLTANVDAWTGDMAIMFYTPWCKYCKQLKPSWDQIAKLTEPVYKDLRVHTFNCEEPTANAELCSELGVDRYPSLYYIGYASFNQAPRKNPFGASEFGGRIARFNADLYPDALYEWIKMLTGVSSLQRKWADLSGVLTGKSHLSGRLDALARENAELKKKVVLFGEELEKHKADKLFDSVIDSGDPFPQLNALTPSPANLPFRLCVGEMTREYCKYHESDSSDRAYCGIIEECSEKEMSPPQCRPRTCPLDSRGCRVASACLQQDVIDAYTKAYAKPSTTSSSASSTGTGTGSAGATFGNKGQGQGQGQGQGSAGAAAKGGER